LKKGTLKRARNYQPAIMAVIFIILFFLKPPSIVKAQTKNQNNNFDHKLYSSNIFLEAKCHYGFIVPHHIGMQVYNSHFPSFEISLAKQTFGEKLWEQMYKYPIKGVSIYYSSLGSSPYLGDVFAAYPYISFPLIKGAKNSLLLKTGVGIAYLTKKFDRINNYKHLAIGSHLNAAINIMLLYSYEINSFNILSLSAGLTHFSNGANKLPNYGLNIPSIALSYAHRPEKKNRNIRKRLYSPVKPYEFDIRKYIDFYFCLETGFKDMEAILGESYQVFGFNANILKAISYKSSFGLGFDITYDASDAGILEKKQIHYDHKSELIKTGINIAYQIRLSKLAFVFNHGYYLSGKEKSDGSVYQKVNLKYALTGQLFANMNLKVHWGKADFIGWGLGYHLKYDYD